MNERISDAAAEAVLRGHVPAGSPELAPVAEAVAALRTVSFEAPPRPSADLALRLDLERAARLSTDRQHASTTAVSPQVAEWTPRRGRRRVAVGAFAGLGLAAKIAIGAVAATAVGVAGAGAAGAVGGLPAPAQEVFEQVTGQHPGGEHVSETGIENSEFGQETAEEARQKAEEQRQAALENAEERRQAGLDNAEEASRTGAEHADGAGEAGLENAGDAGLENAGDAGHENAGETGLETAGEKANADLPEQGGSNEAEEAKERD